LFYAHECLSSLDIIGSKQYSAASLRVANHAATVGLAGSPWRERIAMSENRALSSASEWSVPERRLAAIFAADIAGYSKAMHADESGAMRALQATRRIVDRMIAARHGRIANTAGDSVLAEFASVMDAVCCAVAIQRALAEAEGEAAQFRLRIGIHLGDIMVHDGDLSATASTSPRVCRAPPSPAP
jgi:class 3 adenylate cyclase